MPVRFGLIGYGAWGSCHARAIREIEGCELVAVAAASEATRERARQETGAAAFAGYRQLLASPDVDVADVVAPNHLHETIALEALAAGKHVLLEKPMATSVAGCDRILEAAARYQRLVLVGHELHFSPLYAAMRRLIAEGKIGCPRYVLVDLWRRPYRPGSENWKQDPGRVGSWILEEPVHYFDLVAWFLEGSGEPVSVFARGNRKDPGAPRIPGVNDNFSAVIAWGDGAYGIISQSLSAVEHHLSVKVFGSEGVLRSEWHADMDRSERPSFSLAVSEGAAMRPLEVQSTPGELFELRSEIRAMAAAVRGGAPLPFPPEHARRAVAMCLEAERSIQTGLPVSLPIPLR